MLLHIPYLSRQMEAEIGSNKQEGMIFFYKRSMHV